MIPRLALLLLLLLASPASAQQPDRCEAAATEMFVTSMQMALMLKARDATIKRLEAKLKARPATASACGSKTQVWRTLPNGYRKYRCM
jgi:hypothetical protein